MLLKRLTTATAALALAAGGAGVAAAAGPTPASATPLPPSTSSCTYNGSPSLISGASNTTGTSVTVSCTGLPPSTSLVLVQSSPLAPVVSPSSAAAGEVDLSTVHTMTTDSTGAGSATITVTATGGSPGFSASDSNATCPPTQAQVNAGLTNCLVSVANPATGAGLNFARIAYVTQPSPNAPTLALKPSKIQQIGKTGKNLRASDVADACPTPVTASSKCWWGAAVPGAPNASFGVPGFTVTIDGTATTNTLSASPAVYCASGATATACTGLPAGTLIGAVLSGTIFVPPTSPQTKSTHTVLALEPNITSDLGNGPGNTVAASATFTF